MTLWTETCLAPSAATVIEEEREQDFLQASAWLSSGVLEVGVPPAGVPGEETALTRVARSVMRRGNHPDLALPEFLASPLGRRIQRRVEQGEVLTFLLPAFPAKSSNREKTHGAAPDLGEVLALTNLHQMCEEIAAVHAPGAEVVLASDGRVFHDLVMVSEEDLATYREGIDRILREEGLTHLHHFCLEDCADLFSGEVLEEELVERFGPEIDEIRRLARAFPDQRRMIDGIHRFMKEDLGFHFPELSRNQVMKRSKGLAYQVVQRSRAWDNLLETVFPEALRLSIHPYPVAHRKFGVQLVSTSDRWATPWHNVCVRTAEGFHLMKRREALAAGAIARSWKGYTYYEAR